MAYLEGVLGICPRIACFHLSEKRTIFGSLVSAGSDLGSDPDLARPKLLRCRIKQMQQRCLVIDTNPRPIKPWASPSSTHFAREQHFSALG